MIQNPVFKGFNPDPSICRRGDDYYVAVSSFEWFPGLPVYHSRDLKHWQLLTHVLTDDNNPDLKKLPSAKGIWAPSLTWCEEEKLFYVIYGVMNSMNSRRKATLKSFLRNLLPSRNLFKCNTAVLCAYTESLAYASVFSFLIFPSSIPSTCC